MSDEDFSESVMRLFRKKQQRADRYEFECREMEQIIELANDEDDDEDDS